MNIFVRKEDHDILSLGCFRELSTVLVKKDTISFILRVFYFIDAMSIVSTDSISIFGSAKQGAKDFIISCLVDISYYVQHI